MEVTSILWGLYNLEKGNRDFGKETKEARKGYSQEKNDIDE